MARVGNVAIIGLDAFDSLQMIIYVKDLFKHLPHTDIVYLYKTHPPYTPPSWTTLMTGMPPEVHGIYSLAKPSSKEGKITFKLSVTSLDVRFPRFFEIAAMHGYNYASVNIPLTSPTRYVLSTKDSLIIPLMFGSRNESVKSSRRI